jgi:NAD(P)-dependent dehydrogenase (short-subunit alcohol dehydrogenase family)
MSKINRWIEKNIPDQIGRTIIVTGATSGIGYETALFLAKLGGNVVLASRNERKCKEAAQAIKKQSGDCQVEVIPVDLADLNSVHKFADAFKAEYDCLDILINNAGVMAVPNREMTIDGFEKHFGTNHLGHFALTGLLFGLLKCTAGSRVVTVTSFFHRAGRLTFFNLNSEVVYFKWRAYGRSKLANLMFAYELSRRLDNNGGRPISVAAHPGYASTHLYPSNVFFNLINPYWGQSPRMGALPILYAAASPHINSGDYIGPDGFLGQRGFPKKRKSSRASYNKDKAKRLWELSEELTGVKYI